MRRSLAFALVLGIAPSLGVPAAEIEDIGGGLRVLHGPVNGAVLERDGKRLYVYGSPEPGSEEADFVLFTHHRRDVCWAGWALVDAGSKAVVPAAELPLFRDVKTFWEQFGQKRYHDYAQQTTKVLTRDMPVGRAVKDGDVLKWQDVEVRVLETPGYTRGSVSYLMRIEGKLIAFSGDLILEDGRLLDLYSLQDAIPEAKIGGYHGYAARLADVVTSLENLRGLKLDIVVPARGRIIRDPNAAIDALLGRIRKLYANYLSIDALRWYFKDDHIRAKAKRILGPEARVDWMPVAETVVDELPPWITKIANSRLIVSEDRSGFLIDCGGRTIIDALETMLEGGELRTIEHVFVTHYHDDHTDQLSTLIDRVGATVHACRESWDVLESPGAYRLPAMTANPIHVSGRATSGQRWTWKEFDLSIHHFPGQTMYHDALLVRRQDGDQVFFIGDSFTPTGIDDYCLQNRNILREGTGYLYCLDFLNRNAPDALLINQHVDPAFRYSTRQIAHMQKTLRERLTLLADLLVWDDPNWGLDDGWARLYPYGSRVARGGRLVLQLRILNHSPREQVFETRIHAPDSWRVRPPTPRRLRIPSHEEGAFRIELEVPEDVAAGPNVITADVAWDGVDLRRWTEGIVTVE